MTETNLSKRAIEVLEARYLKRDSKGVIIETPDELFRRVANTVASVDLDVQTDEQRKDLEDQFYILLRSLDFLPNSPTLMNAGTGTGQLSGCFVLPVEDSLDSIFEAVKQTAIIHKSGGGTGFSFSKIRPNGDMVGTTGGVASGPVSFMRAFDTTTDVIKQGGRRRGANMAVLDVTHPDILGFIEAKTDNVSLSNFNLSVAVTENFMNRVEAKGYYSLIHPKTGEVVREASAEEIFSLIIQSAWETGDPGLIFLDRLNADNPTPHLGRIEATNPCGEQPLLPYESCNLGSINLSNMVKNDPTGLRVDYEKLGEIVYLAVRFLDDVIDVNVYPLDTIREATLLTRKIGLGVMGWADLLIKLGLGYGSPESLKLAEEVASFIQEKANEASKLLAETRNCYPASEKELRFGPPLKEGYRNAARTTIAPTGSLSLIAGCSSGIEPIFALIYKRNALGGTEDHEVYPLLLDYISEDEAKDNGLPETLTKVFITAHDISVEQHIEMQATWQKYIDNAVSKTINLPNSATVEDVAKAYMLAYKRGCKGITIYRDGSKPSQVLSKPEATKTKSLEVPRVPRKRPTLTSGTTEKIHCGCGNLYVTVNYDKEGSLCEVFCALGKSGGCAAAQLESTTRLISLALRSGVPVESIVKNLQGIRCPSSQWDRGKIVLSCPDALASVLGGQFATASPLDTKTEATERIGNIGGQCPDCGGLLVYQEGCFLCQLCGYTKC